MKRQFTATNFIIDQDKTLLIFHRKQNKWLPPGGHVEPNEMPHECAIREALEETGYHVELILQENVWVEQPNAVSIPRPWSCQIEMIPAYLDEPAHQHIDFIYISRPIKGDINGDDEGISDIGWFTLEEVENLISGTEIYDDVKQHLRVIFDKSIQFQQKKQ